MISKFTEFLKRISGIGVAGVSIQWKDKNQKKILYNLLVFFSNKRILKYNHGRINKLAAINSLTSIRDEVIKTIQQLNLKSEHTQNLLIFCSIIQDFQTLLEDWEVDENDTLLISESEKLELLEIRSILNGYIYPYVKSDDSFKTLLLNTPNQRFLDL